MYNPSGFAIKDLDELHRQMLDTRLAMLVTHGEQGLQASHLPLLLRPSKVPNGTLYGHFAKANPQWKALQEGAEALVIFAGADAYVSPGFIRAKPNTAKSCRPGTTSPCMPTARAEVFTRRRAPARRWSAP